MAAMLLVAFVLYYLAERACAYELKCSNHSNSSVTFQPSDDLGRYTAKICTKLHPNVTDWSVDLLYNNKAITCNNTHHSRYPGQIHSQLKLYSLDQEVKNYNCSYVCLSTDFEMIFSNCYVIKSTFSENGKEFPPYDTYHNITNKFDLEHFKNNPNVNVVPHEEDTSIYFYMVAPPTRYFVDLCPVDTKNTEIKCVEVTQNCSKPLSDTIKVGCSLSPLYGCYKIWLTHEAPWTSGVFTDLTTVSHSFCLKPPNENLNGSDWTYAWVCGALVLVTGGALLLWRQRDAIALHKHVLRYWTEYSQQSRASVAESGAQGDVSHCRHILLVYAREGPVGQQVADALRTLLMECTSATVHDVFSPETLAAAAAAGAPADWVRTLLARTDCRLLVLQTPALACLHPAPRPSPPQSPSPPPTPAAHTLSEPLLGGRALYRMPQFGDTLAQFALRLLDHSNAHQQDLPAYKKYYLATLSDLQTEVFPQVVPFRRYALPEAAPLLLAHLAEEHSHQAIQQIDVCENQALQQLKHATQEFVLHVRDNPDYLLDELVFT